MSGVVAFLTIACVLAPVFYTVYILMDEYQAFKHGGGSSAIGHGRETTVVNSTDLAHDSPISASSAAAARGRSGVSVLAHLSTSPAHRSDCKPAGYSHQSPAMARYGRCMDCRPDGGL